MNPDQTIEAEKMNAVVTLKVGVGLAQRAGRLMMCVPTGKMAEITEAFESVTKACVAAMEYYQMLEEATGVEHPVLEQLRAALTEVGWES